VFGVALEAAPVFCLEGVLQSQRVEGEMALKVFDLLGCGVLDVHLDVPVLAAPGLL